MRKKIIGITGHRTSKITSDGSYNMTTLDPKLVWIATEIHKILDKYNPVLAITGMALGTDTLFAKICRVRKLPFIAAIPCYGQQNKWNKTDRNIYENILESELCITKYINECQYFDGCMQTRNEWICNNSDLLISVHDGSPGGTQNCINYAKKIGLEIININPKDYGQITQNK